LSVIFRQETVSNPKLYKARKRYSQVVDENRQTMNKTSYIYLSIILILLLLNFSWFHTIGIMDNIYSYLTSFPFFYSSFHPVRAKSLQLSISFAYILINFFTSYKMYKISKSIININLKRFLTFLIIMDILSSLPFFIF